MWKPKPPRSDSRRFYFYDPTHQAQNAPPAKNVFTENQLNIHKYLYRF